jgi:histidinol-phosphate aminotransferase
MLNARPSVQRMRPYAAPTAGRAEMRRLDFNENTRGCSPRVLEAVREAASRSLLGTYPDAECAHREMAEGFGVSPAQMVLTNGTDEAIALLVGAYVEPGGEVVLPEPTYAMYRFYAEAAGARVKAVPAPAPYAAVPADALVAAIGPSTQAVFVANPNNPTGTAFSSEELRRIIQANPSACVLVDEAYFEFHGETMLPELEAHPNLFVCRTFSKAYGLAGLRLGALFSRAENLEPVRRCRSPYSVNALALVAGVAALRDREYVQGYAAEVRASRDRIESALRDQGIRYVPSRANFVLLDAGARAEALLAAARRSGILLRDRRHEFPGAVRVTVGTAEDADRFLGVLEEVL